MKENDFLPEPFRSRYLCATLLGRGGTKKQSIFLVLKNSILATPQTPRRNQNLGMGVPENKTSVSKKYFPEGLNH